ncbi:M43 family zinc metalloprotease [Nonomuraea sp. NPDC003727]
MSAAALMCLLAVGHVAVPPAEASATTPEGCRPAIQDAHGHAAGGRAEPDHHEPVDDVLADLQERLRGRSAGPAASVTVPLWVHVLTDGNLRPTDEAVASQVAIINAAYAGSYGGADTGIRFRLDGVTITNRPQWFANPLANDTAIKTELRRGGSDTLNLYIGQLTPLMLGYSTYPFWYQTMPRTDGVVVDWRSLPGGSLANFNGGRTAVHEIGHWLGLFHTFENGCTGTGDGVDDTPPQAQPTAGCPEGKDTCAQPGLDPIHNYMDYSYDGCMTEFTQGQAVRMHEMWAAYRALRSEAASAGAQLAPAQAGSQTITPAQAGSQAVTPAGTAAQPAPAATGAQQPAPPAVVGQQPAPAAVEQQPAPASAGSPQPAPASGGQQPAPAAAGSQAPAAAPSGQQPAPASAGAQQGAPASGGAQQGAQPGTAAAGGAPAGSPAQPGPDSEDFPIVPVMMDVLPDGPMAGRPVRIKPRKVTPVRGR